MFEKKIFISDMPNLLKEWDLEKNENLKPENFPINSHKKIWWRCSQNHLYEMKISDKTRGNGCPYCSGHRVLIGFNDLTTTHPELCKEWNYEANSKYKPTDFSKGSSFNAWWKCAEGHSFQTSIASRTNKRIGCPYCSGRYAIKGVNDLVSINPVLASEWDYEKNENLKPEDVLPNSHKIVWWICKKCKNSWNAQIKSRNRGNGCPICGRKQAAQSKATPKIGESFAELFPEILKEWDYEKNNKINPLTIKPSSVKKVFWKCAKGHSWEAKVSYRTLRNNGCPECYAPYKSSFPEQAIYYYLSQFFNTVNRDSSHGYEFDIFLKDENIAIEYDGLYWHSSDFAKSMELRKNEYCKTHSIKLYRIKESNDRTNPVNKEENIITYYYDTAYTFLDAALKQLFMCIEKDVKKTLLIVPNVAKDRNFIISQFEQKKVQKSIIKCPTIVSEWDYDANKGLLPENVSLGSEQKINWICSKGHKYSSRVSHRVNGVGCPYCSGKKILVGENDLASKNPKLATEWNYDKNGDLLPTHVFPTTNKKVWWKCVLGHEWEATINSRNNGRGCPFCSGRNYPKIHCIETNKIYNTYEEIELELGVRKSNVSQVVHKKRKTTKGYHFEFTTDKI